MTEKKILVVEDDLLVRNFVLEGLQDLPHQLLFASNGLEGLKIFDTEKPDLILIAVITPAVRVVAIDAMGNAATSFAGSVIVAIGSNPSGGTLSGTNSVAAVAGVATFSTLSINKSGTGYTLQATATGITAAGSQTFAILPGPASALTITVQPGQTVVNASIVPAVEVTARDASGNTATGFTGNVVMTLENAPGATLLGTTTVAAVGGVATFSDLHINKSGNAYNLRATTSSPALTQTSTTFNITPAPTAQLVFNTQPPASTQASSAMNPAVVVTAQDVFFNTTPSFAGQVT